MYYNLLYVFINFFLLGIYLSVLQLDLFTAFLWLLECTIIFIFLLLLFFLNIKGYTSVIYKNVFILFYTFIFLYLIVIDNYQEQAIWNSVNIFFYSLLDNFFESLYNSNNNDLFGFLISYYSLNGTELVIIGFLLLVGSVICVNFNKYSKNISLQNYNSFLKVFNFFEDFITFCFLRKQDLINQGFTKAALKIFFKK